MIIDARLRGAFVIPAGASLVGLVLGMLIGLLPEFSAVRAQQDDWTPFQELRSSDVKANIQRLLASPQWEKAAVVEESEEKPLQVAGKPGALAYLSVVAIVSEPQTAALLHVDQLPAMLKEELLVSPDANGVITVQTGDSVVAGWSIVEISESGVTLGEETDTAESSEERKLVQYNLYEWNR